MFDDGNRRSIFSPGEQKKLLGMREDNVRKLADAIRRQIDRINRAGCGLTLEVIPEVPGRAKAVFYLAHNPQRRVIGTIDGNILNLRGQDCATQMEFKSVLQWVTRSLTLGFGDEFDELPARTSAQAPNGSSTGDHRTQPGTGLVPVTQATDARGTGFVREIKLD